MAEILPVGNGGAGRAAQRWPVHGDVLFVAPHRGRGTVLNASVGGMRIATSWSLEVGGSCVARVHTPDAVTFEHMQVVWEKQFADGCVYGLRFVGAS